MATRDLTASMITAVQAPTTFPAILYEGEFDDGAGGSAFVRLWTGIGPLTWNGLTWQGAGSLIGFAGIAESTELRANAWEAWLTGANAAVTAAAMTATRKNRSGKLYLALFPSAGSRTPIDAPYLIAQGRYDTSPIDDSGDTSKIVMRYEDLLVMLQIPRERRYTPEDQALRDPADTGFRFIAKLQDSQFLLPV